MKRLKELREKKGISQQKLANEFNLSQQSIYKYENDLAEPDISTLIKLSHYFETSIDYLVGNTDIPYMIEYRKTEDLNSQELSHLLAYRKASKNIRSSIDEILKEFNKLQA